MSDEKPPTGDDPHPYKQLMELVYSADRRREAATGAETTRATEDGQVTRLFDRVSGRLSGKQKAAFVLREMEDRDTSEIAEILHCGESTVRNHLFNARRILRREIEKIYPGFFTVPGKEKA